MTENYVQVDDLAKGLTAEFGYEFSSQKVNQILIELKFQRFNFSKKRPSDSSYEILGLGKSYGMVTRFTTRRFFSGSHVVWQNSVLDILIDHLWSRFKTDHVVEPMSESVSEFTSDQLQLQLKIDQLCDIYSVEKGIIHTWFDSMLFVAPEGCSRQERSASVKQVELHIQRGFRDAELIRSAHMGRLRATVLTKDD